MGPVPRAPAVTAPAARAAGDPVAAEDPPWPHLVELLPSPVAVLRADGTVVAASSRFTDLVDPAAQAEQVRAAVGQVPWPRTDEPDAAPVETAVQSRAGTSLGCTVQPLRRPDGRPGWLLLHLDHADGAAHDALTGLVGREVLVERLRQALAHQERHGGDVQVVVVDLDRFKRVNDVHGHVVGDEVLVEVARRLQAVSRPEDTVCRWGGDEFVLLLADEAPTDGELVCGRIRSALDPPVQASHGEVLTVSASCGWVRAGRGADPIELMRAADLLMYERKRRARSIASGRERGDELRQRLARAHARAQALHEALDQTRRRRARSWPPRD